MSSNIKLASESFSDTQLSIAVGIQERELGRIEAETIDWKWNSRQKHMLHILGARALQADNGKSIEPLTVTEFQDIFVEEMGVTLTTTQTDIRALEDADMIEKPYLNGSNKKKEVLLTENGFSKWREYANRRTALVFAIHDALIKTGGLPNTWHAKVGKWVSSLVGDKAKAAAVALVCLGFAGAPNEAKADVTSTASFVFQSAVSADTKFEGSVGVSFGDYEKVAITAAKVLNNDISTAVELQAMPASALASSKSVNIEFHTPSIPFMTVSIGGLYEKLLPNLSKITTTDDEALSSNPHLTATQGWKHDALEFTYIDESHATDAKPFGSYWTQNVTEDAPVSIPFKVAGTEQLYDRLLPKATTNIVVKY